jgi:hypothetical protein
MRKRVKALCKQERDSYAWVGWFSMPDYDDVLDRARKRAVDEYERQTKV